MREDEARKQKMRAALDIIRLICIIIYYYLEAIFSSFIKPKRKDISGRTVLITGKDIEHTCSHITGGRKLFILMIIVNISIDFYTG